MTPNGSGAVLTFGGSGIGVLGPGGFKIARDAVAAVGAGVGRAHPPGDPTDGRRPGSLPDSLPEDERLEITSMIDGATLLGRSAVLADVGDVAAFAASDLARSITGTEINITCGVVLE